MIEVEAKFLPKDADMGAVLEGAKLISNKRTRDVYYDTADYDLLKKDWWLRQRDGRWELKRSVGEQSHIYTCEEHYDTAEICQLIGVKSLQTITAQWQIIFDFFNNRKSYRKENIRIDIDTVEAFDNFSYQIAEVEVTGKNKQEAQELIDTFLNAYNIPKKQILTKGLAIAQKYNTELYDLMREYLR